MNIHCQACSGPMSLEALPPAIFTITWLTSCVAKIPITMAN